MIIDQEQKFTNQTQIVAAAIIVSKKLEKGYFDQKFVCKLNVKVFQKLKNIFEMISNKHQPIKPRISSVENIKHEKNQQIHEYLHQTPS
jgi:hypothetical protein